MSYIHKNKVSLSIGIIKLDNTERILYINNLAKDLLNISYDITNESFYKLFYSLYGQEGLKNYIEYLGKHLLLERHLFPNYTLITIADITEIKKAHEENKIFKEILDKISDGVRINDKDDVIVYCNNSCESIEGINKEHCIGRKESEVYKYEKPINKDLLKAGNPIIDQVSNYKTIHDENVNLISSTFPYFEDDNLLKTYSIIRSSNKVKSSIGYNDLYPTKDIDKIMKKNGTYYTFNSIIGENENFKRTLNFAYKIARNNSSVLIIGETGTGKELFAQSIHNASTFANGPFIAVNCAAIPDNLVESVLFGTVEGAFTGAKNNQGLLYQANNGTIFLDELNSLNLDSQAKLLRFLQDRTIRSVGDNKEKKVFCRVISAVNKDIEQEIKDNKIREDLYYRLATVVLNIPPLIERTSDIPVLTRFFIEKYKENFDASIIDLDDDLMELLMKYNWPGNVRELEHVIESAMNLVDSDERILRITHLSTYLQQKLSLSNTSDIKEEPLEKYSSDEPLHEILAEVEKQVIMERLLKNQGNITQTAKDLGIFRQALQYRIKKHDIDYLES